MTIESIMQQANVKADDTISADVLLIYFNSAVNKINLDCGLRLPIIKPAEAAGEYSISEEEFVNEAIGQCIVAFIAYSIKQTEGYENENNTFYNEFLALKLQFQNRYSHLVKQDLKLTDEQNGSVYRATNDQLPRLNIFKKTKLW